MGRGSGRELRSFEGHTNYVRSCSFSPDGQTLVSGSDDKTLKLWDVATGQCLATWKTIRPVLSVTQILAPGSIFPESSHDTFAHLLAAGLTNGTVLLLDLTEVSQKTRRFSV